MPMAIARSRLSRIAFSVAPNGELHQPPRQQKNSTSSTASEYAGGRAAGEVELEACRAAAP